MNKNPIDIVIPWVDGADLEWQKEKNHYKSDSLSDSSDSRYREWGTLKYWFRAIEEYMPWVRTIHFVTYGHLPSWLNDENSKLNIVNHSDFIPEKYLPTFSSHTIELNLHRIPGLSENFIYFNDDLFVTQKLHSSDFFVNGKPVDTAVMGVIKNTSVSNYMPYIMLNMLAIINERFNKKEIIKNNIGKWLTPRYGKLLLNNIYLLPWSYFTGFRNFHTCNAFCKSTYENVWNNCFDILDETCTRKFRDKRDVNQYLIRYWQLCEGYFIPKKSYSQYFTMGIDNIQRIEEGFFNKNIKILCVNDDPTELNFEKDQKLITDILEKKYPKKSSYER